VWKQVILKEAVSGGRGGSADRLNTRLGAVIIYYGIVGAQVRAGVLGRAVPCLAFKTSLPLPLPLYRGIRSLSLTPSYRLPLVFKSLSLTLSPALNHLCPLPYIVFLYAF